MFVPNSMRGILSVTLIVAGSFTVSTAAWSAVESKPSQVPTVKTLEAVPGEFVVELRHERARFNQADLERKLGGKIVRDVRPDMVVVKTNKRMNALFAAQAMTALPEVRIAEPNYIFHAFKTPNDPDFGKLWGMNNTGLADSAGARGVSGLDIGATKAWDIQTGSKSVVVAVVDTGVDYTHPDLANNIWTNVAEANGKAGVDDDGNGFIDDIHGYNFVANTGDPMDDNGHGSHCSGTIGGEGNNGIGVAGVNWNVSIMAVKFLDAQGGGTLENAVKAIDYTIKMKVPILSNSWGGTGQSDILKDAVARTTAAGQLFVAAAGNDGTDNDKTGTAIPSGYPLDNILSVAAIDNRGSMAYFSNFGAKSVHVAAPGVNVYSSSMKGGYETMSGTSMATPHVTGIAALLLAQEPGFSYQQLKARIISSARPLKALNGKIASGGLADAYYTITGLTPPADPNDPSVWTGHTAAVGSTDHPYAMDAKVTFTFKVPGAKKVAVHFSKFQTEAGYDKAEFFDAAGASYGVLTGAQDGQFGPIVDGDTVVLTFTSDHTVNAYGFDVDGLVFQ